MELGLNSTYYLALSSILLKDAFSIYSKSSFFFSLPVSLDLGKRVWHFSDQFGLMYKARFMLERAVCETAIVQDTPMFHVCIF